MRNSLPNEIIYNASCTYLSFETMEAIVHLTSSAVRITILYQLLATSKGSSSWGALINEFTSLHTNHMCSSGKLVQAGDMNIQVNKDNHQVTEYL